MALVHISPHKYEFRRAAHVRHFQHTNPVDQPRISPRTSTKGLTFCIFVTGTVTFHRSDRLDRHFHGIHCRISKYFSSEELQTSPNHFLATTFLMKNI